MQFRTILSLLAIGVATITTLANDKDDVLRDTTQLGEVVVTGSRSATDVRHLPMTVSTIDRERLLMNERTSVLPAVMEEVPGVVVTSRGVMGYGVSTGGTGSINVRGLSSSSGRMLVLIDGHPQYQGVFGHGIGDSYQTMIADRVEVLRGPASLLYGTNAMGGVVNIVTRKQEPVADGKLSQHTTLNAGAGSYGTMQVEGSNRLRVGRFSSNVAAQYQRSDNHRPNMGFEQYGGFVSLGYRLSDHWNASAMADITRFNASNPVKVSDNGLVEPISDNDQGIVRGSANLVFENRYERTSGALSVYNNYGNHRIDDGYVAGKAAQTDFFRSRDAVAGVSLYQNFQASSTTSITAGIDYQHIYGRAWYEDKATGAMVTSGQRITMRQSGHAHENEVAAYADVRQEVTKYVTLSAGLRYDHHSVAGGEWIPQAGLVVRPIGTGEFKFMFSKGFRNPTNMELYLYPKANEELRAERMLNYEIGWRQRLTDGRLTYGVNLFLIDGDNMIMTVNRRNINTGEFRNMGVEAEAAWKVNCHWRLSTNHSYLHMDKPIAGAPDYKGYVGADCVYGRFTATAGLQQLVDLHTRFDKENATLLHMTLAYRLCPQVKIWARGENLLAEQYEIEYGYPMPKATFMGGVSLDF